MEQIGIVCPEPEFKLFVRKRLEAKVSWTMAGVVVAIFTVVALLVFSAYSTGQEEQSECIKENSAQVQELKTNVKVMQTEFAHVRDKLQDLKDTQKTQTEAILLKLDGFFKEKGSIGR